MIRIFIKLVLVFYVSSSYSNPANIESYFNLLKNEDFTSAKSAAQNFQNEQMKKSLLYLADLRMDKKNLNLDFSPSKEDPQELQFVKRLLMGYQYTYASKQSNLDAYKEFSQALNIGETLKNNSLIKTALISMLDLFSSEIFIGGEQYVPFLERFGELRSDRTDEALFVMYSIFFHTKANDSPGEDVQYYYYLDKMDSIFELIPQTHNFYPRYYFEKGLQYRAENKNEKSANYLMKADSLSAKKDYLESFRGTIAWQLSLLQLQNGNLEKAKKYLDVSKKFSTKLRDSFYNDRLNSAILAKESNYDSAYHYLRKSVDIEYQLGYKNNTLESSILTVQNQTDKLKLDKLELDAQNRKNRNWATVLATLLILGSAIAFLIYSNTKRKQLLAEQGKTLQEQKVATLLKEQELTTIDAMIEGQEKERQRIANDLHDDLGGLMANVKLHFNSLQEKNKNDEDELYGKTNTLLDEAYNKIRAIAHAKNSGVIAKQGLLKAVEQMAEKVSVANRISITVKDFGLDNRLENSLELNLFRIIQELITNIIKHSNATNANIHLTNHGETLNILVEDNGIGFDTRKISANEKGMGLRSIDKRIAHLEGTLHIESEPGKGATIIIDIPV